MAMFKAPHEVLSSALVEIYKNAGTCPRPKEALLDYIRELEESNETIRIGSQKLVAMTRQIRKSEEGGLEDLRILSEDAIVLLGPGYRCIKLCTGDSLYCQEKSGDHTIWYWQIGDNTGSLRYARGEDPYTAALQPVPSVMLQKPLELIKVFRSFQPHHWHYITYGLSDLYDEPDSPERQYELSFRLACDEHSDVPEAWPMVILQSIAQMLRQTSRFEGEFTIKPRGKFSDGSNITMENFVLANDKQLKSIGTGNGTIKVLQVVGLTKAEAEADASSEILDKLRQGNQLLVTDIRRQSVV